MSGPVGNRNKTRKKTDESVPLRNCPSSVCVGGWGVEGMQFDMYYEGKERGTVEHLGGPPNPDLGCQGKETSKLRPEDK